MNLKIFKHLLPNAKAWKITKDKDLRRFFKGLTGLGSDTKVFFDGIWRDIFPQTTREIDLWENQFGLKSNGSSEQERRDRLDAAWKALGGQDPRYIQDTLQSNGFDVYVHEWWEPGSEPNIGIKSCATPRNPFLVLRKDSLAAVSMVDCGEPLAACGEPFAECGNSLVPLGHVLVNKIFVTSPDYTVLCGEPLAECGEPLAECGEFVNYKDKPIEYSLPADEDKWAYFLYIGGETYGDLASVPETRRDEFEELCLKICPTQLWLGIIVQYS